jgi:hypothetical protein
MVDEKKKLVGSELDDLLKQDFNFESDRAEPDNKDSEPTSKKSTPKLKINKNILIISILLFVISAVAVAYLSFFVQDNNQEASLPIFINTQPQVKLGTYQPTKKILEVKEVKEDVVKAPVATKKPELLKKITPKTNNIKIKVEAINKITTLEDKINKDIEQVKLSSKKSTSFMIKKINRINKKVDEVDGQRTNNTKMILEAKKEAEIGHISLNKEIKLIKQEILALGSNNTQNLSNEMKSVIDFQDKERVIVKGDIDRLTEIYTKISKTITNQTQIITLLKKEVVQLTQKIKEIESKPELVIENFMTYDMIGFDSRKLVVWLKDSKENVVKVEKGSFLPEYGTVVAITKEGQIITKLGMVKISKETKETKQKNEND